MATTNETELRLTAVIEPEGTQFVGRCPELDVATCGDSVEDAYANLVDATELYLDTLRETGQLERVLTERGLAATGQPVFTTTFTLPLPAA